MRFVLYTELTVRQCATSLTERMEAKETKSRPAVDGKVEKGGKFTISTRQSVIASIKHTTRLRATAERSSGMTTITGYVPSGVPRHKVGIVMAAIAFVGLVMIANGNGLLGIVALAMAPAIYVPLVGDYDNGTFLYNELKKATKGKLKPIK